MNRNDILVRADEILHERVSLDELDSMAIEYIRECVKRCQALDKVRVFYAPKITVKDKEFNETYEFGYNVHDRLRIQRITESSAYEGKACTVSANLLAYENLQNGDGSFGGYDIVTDDEDGCIPMRSVIEANEEIFPSKKPYCAICGSDHNLQQIITTADWRPLWYCDKCDQLTEKDLVKNPVTESDKAKNLLIGMKMIFKVTKDEG